MISGTDEVMTYLVSSGIIWSEHKTLSIHSKFVVACIADIYPCQFLLPLYGRIQNLAHSVYTFTCLP